MNEYAHEFLQLSEVDGDPILINVAHIIAIFPRNVGSGGTNIKTTDKLTISVRQKFGQVTLALNDGIDSRGVIIRNFPMYQAPLKTEAPKK